MAEALGQDYWRSTLSGHEVDRIRERIKQHIGAGDPLTATDQHMSKTIAVLGHDLLEDGHRMEYILRRGAEEYRPFNEVMNAVVRHSSYSIYQPHYQTAKQEYDTELACRGWGQNFTGEPKSDEAQWIGSLSCDEIHWAKARIRLGEPHQDPALQQTPVSAEQLIEALLGETGIRPPVIVNGLNSSLPSFEPWDEFRARVARAGHEIDQDSPLRADYNAVLLMAHDQIHSQGRSDETTFETLPWDEKAAAEIRYMEQKDRLHKTLLAEHPDTKDPAGRARYDETMADERRHDNELAARSKAAEEQARNDDPELADRGFNPEGTEEMAVVGKHTAATQRSERETLVESQPFKILVGRLEACGFDAQNSKGLGGCIERGWSFDQVEAELGRKGAPLEYPGDAMAAKKIVAMTYNAAAEGRSLNL